jgi:hypothetical protein
VSGNYTSTVKAMGRLFREKVKGFSVHTIKAYGMGGGGAGYTYSSIHS